MKSENSPGNSRTSTDTFSSNEKDAHANNVEVGSVGIEGGNDNGASTLRVLKKKHAGGTVPSKKPIRHHL